MVIRRFSQLFVCTLTISVLGYTDASAQFAPPTVGGRFQNESGFYTKDIITIPVRAGAHDGYSRLVFEWPEKVVYEVTAPSDGVLEVAFQRKALVDMSGVRTAATSFGKIDVISGLGRPLRVRLAVPPGSTYKNYTLGYKVVVDVYKAGAQKPDATTPVSTPEKGQIENPAPQASSITTPPTTTQPKLAQDLESLSPTISVTPEPLPTMIFGWTATTAFKVSAFVHNGALYFVSDQDGQDFPPKVKVGSLPDGAIKKIPAKTGSVYRLTLPAYPQGDAPQLVSEGGGLVWGFTMNPAQPPDLKGVPLTPSVDKNHARLTAVMKDKPAQLTFTDPDTGEAITAIMVSDHVDVVTQSYQSPDMEVIEGGPGLAIRPLNDQLKISIDDNAVTIDSAIGLIATPNLINDDDAVATAPLPNAAAVTPQPLSLARRIFYFDRWLVGLPEDYSQARQLLETKLNKAPPAQKPEILIALGKFQLAKGFAPEALGYLDLGAIMVPAMNQDPEFRALRGAALALIGDNDNALRDLLDPALDTIPEIAIWRAFAAAQSYNWDVSFRYLPTDMAVLSYYPRRIQRTLIYTLTETLLRVNRPEQAEALLKIANSNGENSDHEDAAQNYLLGEAKRLQNKNVAAVALWNKVETSNDQLYRVKAILAKTVLQLQERAVKPEEAIERLERLRFAWRGDGLETQIAQVLGRLYLTNKKWDKAFEMMRDAAGFSAGSQEGNAIAASMTQAFSQLYTNPPPELKAADAIALYDRFPELTPAGEEGKAVQRGLAQFLLDVDLLDRAGDVYEKLVPQGTNGVETLNDGLQLSAVRLLARTPQKALDAVTTPPISNAVGTLQQQRQKILLHARALADLKKPDEALTLLANLSVANDSLSLIADTAWKNGRWALAAQSLALILERSKPSDVLTKDQIDLIVNRAVALRLANNETALQSLRTQYLGRITDDTKKRQLNAISRAAIAPTLADRETLLNIANEVDLFAGFLNESTKAPTAKPIASTPDGVKRQ